MTQQTITRQFERYCDEIVKKYRIPGFSIGLARDGKKFYENSFGYRNTDQQLPLSSDTVFGIGSVTKSFTCVAILQLQEAGKLSVHDPVIKFLPQFKTNNEEYTKQITIHHFMTHTAGLPPLSTLFTALKKSIENDPKFDEDKPEGSGGSTGGDQAAEKSGNIETYADLMESIAKEEYTLLGPPGIEFSYSNDSFALLGAIIERVSGVSYEDYIKDYILKPAGMEHSVFHLHELAGHDDVSSLYNSRKKDGETIVFESSNPWDAPSMRAAGFLKSTVNDMLQYAEIFRNQGKVGDVQILSPESVELMTTPYIECGHEHYYGYGLMIIPDFFGYKLVEHGGSIKGVAAQLNIIPELGLSGVSFANLAGVPSTKLLFSAFAECLGKAVDASYLNPTEFEVSEKKLMEYEGEYKSNEWAKYRVQVMDGKLHLSGEGLDSASVRPIGNDRFFVTMRETEYSLRFIRNEVGEITRIGFGFRQTPKVVG